MSILADHKFLVELACSTTLVPGYEQGSLERILGKPFSKEDSVVFIVCGGTKISVEELAEYDEYLKGMQGTKMTMNVEGKSVDLGALSL